MTIVVDVLVVLAVAITAWCIVGFSRARDPFVRLHFMTPVSTLATFALALAIVLSGAPADESIKAMIVFVVTAVTSPITQHKIARAMWVRRNQGWRLPEGEQG